MPKLLVPFPDYVDENGTDAVVPLRRDKFRPGKEGPNVPLSPGYTYDWDIEPDITFMLALNLFQGESREFLRLPELSWLLAEPKGVCPYLTFELKCAAKSGKERDAKYRISAASVVWLYQRKRLKDRLGSSDYSDLRHHSIILNFTYFHVWVATFDGKIYSLQKMAHGLLDEPEGVEKYAKWVEAIHTWGLGTNARAFKRDVEALYRKTVEQAS